MVEQEQKPVDYEIINAIISGDGEVKGLKKNLERARISLQGLVNSAEGVLKTRLAKLVVTEDMGFYGANTCHDKELSRVFPKDKYGKEIRKEQGVTMFDFTDEAGHKNTVYYSWPLGIFVLGEPKRKADGLYCQITGEKISD
ncbi:hypothetical protein HOD75_01080 [archaeon]|jgi:hypothetical protein|nr:hypothetical protein [Candidatus Woesearchaeota archaeon]MBT4135940.1 hypothetical protein [archaeon]MBT4241471.1 hypothetical protein [archaeon]MBT4417658.1 hypothetical protein [archaeon]